MFIQTGRFLVVGRGLTKMHNGRTRVRNVTFASGLCHTVWTRVFSVFGDIWTDAVGHCSLLPDTEGYRCGEWEIHKRQKKGETEGRGEVASVRWIHRSGVNVIFYSQLVQWISFLHVPVTFHSLIPNFQSQGQKANMFTHQHVRGAVPSPADGL